eukprot:8060999-Pyramimonas_sp.AAC.1
MAAPAHPGVVEPNVPQRSDSQSTQHRALRSKELQGASDDHGLAKWHCRRIPDMEPSEHK